MKSEPESFSIDDLERLGVEHWDGIRNYQARNMMRDEMKLNDQVFFYHSSCDEPGIAGVMKVAGEAYPDFTAFDPESKYYDPRSKPDTPSWMMVDVAFVRRTRRIIPLTELKAHVELNDMALVRKGNRLSIMPVSAAEWKFILALEKRCPGAL